MSNTPTGDDLSLRRFEHDARARADIRELSEGEAKEALPFASLSASLLDAIRNFNAENRPLVDRLTTTLMRMEGDHIESPSEK